MLSRYTMYRRRPKGAPPLPQGIRKDTRHGGSHILRPEKQIVETFLDAPDSAAWRTFREKYRALLETRFDDDRAPFDELAAMAENNDIYIGCNCPTKKNPVRGRCHTYVALEFMREKYPDLEVVIPETP